MIQLSAVHKAFGARVLLDAVTWQVQPGDRVGLCGPNGAGKTTLLRLMAGLEEPDTGRLARPANLTVGYLPQDGVVHAGRTLFEEAAGAFDELAAIETEMREIEARLAAAPGPDQQQLLSRYSELQDTFLHQGGYDVEARVNAVLRGLGFQEADLGRPTEHFSGGWQMRIALAKLLLRRPRLLLMDEPTNHLDLEARNWLEDFLIGYPYAVVLVSHDRYFLDKVVTSIAEISLRSITTCPGSYSSYLVERDARLAKLRERKRLQDEEVARMQAFIDRFRYQATKAAQVQSRVKMLEKITPIEVPPERKRVHFKFPASARSGRMVLELRGVRKAYGPLEVFRSADVHIERGDRIALVGPNGSGKSTLMRMLSGVEAPDAGERLVGSGVVARYFAQDEAARLDPVLNVYETLSAGSPISMVPAIRNILGGFLFEGDDIYKRAGVLSGGERTRLAVARMLLHPSNTLLLDEPTNHLDIDSTNVLLDALTDYGGTLIFVSHDRYFVDKLATKVLDIGRGDANLYPGTYEEFRWSREQQSRRQEPDAREKRPASRPAARAARGRAAKPRPPRNETHRLERRLKSLRARIAELEQRIGEREQSVRGIEANIAQPDFYSDAAGARARIDEHQTLMWEVGNLMNQWEALQSEAEDLSRQVKLDEAAPQTHGKR
ncbi:MAG: ABC-F family ATP-binding cassette domain-containing protein [Acidobacteria bacterium]|nr:ABC-F family ATP-binding cassette domain-containing protein [Acidobacteriota bacterium]